MRTTLVPMGSVMGPRVGLVWLVIFLRRGQYGFDPARAVPQRTRLATNTGSTRLNRREIACFIIRLEFPPDTEGEVRAIASHLVTVVDVQVVKRETEIECSVVMFQQLEIAAHPDAGKSDRTLFIKAGIVSREKAAVAEGIKAPIVDRLADKAAEGRTAQFNRAEEGVVILDFAFEITADGADSAGAKFLAADERFIGHLTLGFAKDLEAAGKIVRVGKIAAEIDVTAVRTRAILFKLSLAIAHPAKVKVDR